LFACAGIGCGGPAASVPPSGVGAPDASQADVAARDAGDGSPGDGSPGDGSRTDGAPSDAGDASRAGTLDCAWAMDSGNCFQAPLAAAATQCAVGEVGTLSADQTKCTFSTGEVVTFATPLTNDGGGVDLTGFTLDTDGGGTCLGGSFSNDGNSYSITSAAGTISVVYQPSTQTVTLTCPDGATYSGDATSLSACNSALPGLSIASSAPGSSSGPYLAIGVGLSGTGMSQDVPIFNCNHP
jgi:hypothetical protein